MAEARLLDHNTLLRLCRSRDFLAANFDQPLRLDEAARAAHLSKFHYLRLFREAFGETPLQFLTRQRMDRACALLAAGDENIVNVCLSAGYSSLGSFTTRFRQFYGCAPGEYRERYRRVFAIRWPGVHIPIPACFLQFYGAEPQYRRSACGASEAILKP